MKKQRPDIRLRDRASLARATEVATTQTQSCGLEAPEVAFVEKSAYEAEFGPLRPEDIIVESFQGQLMEGVNVQVGRKGWFKRVHREEAAVKDPELSIQTLNIISVGSRCLLCVFANVMAPFQVSLL